uniref:Solute carrier organic anion transporter family member n=2 Tax=Cacopsylla melanoneura TaxID=428564 RepID=A0A8D8QN49_9HEMI
MVELVDGSGGTNSIEHGTSNHHASNHTEQEKMLPTMKKELSKKELKLEEREKLKDIKSNLELTKDIQCGIGFFRGRTLQKFATQETFVLLYGILGATINMAGSYFSGTISTMEKRFRIPSQNMGIILIGNDLTALFFGILVTYYAGRKHKPRYICIGMLFIVSMCICCVLPHLIYGAGKEALSLTKEYGGSNNTINVITDSKLCSKTGAACIKEESLTPQVIIFVGELMWGIGAPLYGNLGMAYMDDNIKRSKTPLLMSFSFFIRMLGPVGGYALASWCLAKFISPDLTPTIDMKDPRWLGAWWLGWIIIGSIMTLFSFLVALFPKELPNSAVRKILSDQSKDEATKKQEREDKDQPSWKDMRITFQRLFKNKVLIYNTAASSFYVFGYYPYWTFMPKYIEIEYRVTASFAALITGVVGLVFTALGIMLSGGVISMFKPRARSLAAFNICAGIITMFGLTSFIFLGCAENDAYNLSVGRANMPGLNTCSKDCNCEFAQYAPVCSMDGTHRTFISPCHAGCRSSTIINDTEIYQNCSCVTNTNSQLPFFLSNHTSRPDAGRFNGGSAKKGSCTIDCTTQFYMFLGVVCLLKFVGSSAKTTNVLLSVRSVEDRDKAVSMSFGMTVLSLAAFIPAPIVFGWIMDQTCILWGKTCSGQGSCWVYDAAQLRLLLVSSTVFLIALSNICDVAVWYHVKDIQIFDEDVGEDRKKKKKEEQNKHKSEYNPVNQNSA